MKAIIKLLRGLKKDKKTGWLLEHLSDQDMQHITAGRYASGGSSGSGSGGGCDGVSVHCHIPFVGG